MRDTIQALTKAAVTGLIKPDDLIVDAGHKAIDLLFGWLPGRDKSRLERLVEEVGSELQELADKEFAGNADLEPAIGNATTLFKQHGPTAGDLIALNLKPDEATKALLGRGEAIFSMVDKPVADLCRLHIVPQVVGRLLADWQFIEELKPAITSTVLSRLDEILQLLKAEPRQRIDIDGQGNIVVQVLGNDNRIDLGRSYLRLTRYQTRRVAPSERSDAEVLSPYSRSIPLVGRHDALADLRAWLAGGTRISIRVATGEAGSGKTRLALELCEEVIEWGWAAGFVESTELVRFRDKQNLADWGWGRPTLLVIDYAAVHAAHLNSWFSELADHTSANRALRILLLERHAIVGSGWWQAATESGWGTHTVSRLFDPPEPWPVRPLRSADTQRAILTDTLEAMGSAIRPPAPNTAPAFDRQLAEVTWGGQPLFLMMAALLVGKSGFDRVLALSRTDLAFDIVTRHELPRLRKFGGGDESTAVMLVHMAAYVTLCGRLGHEDLLAAIEQEKGVLRRDSSGDAASLYEALGIALPGPDGTVAPVLPDVIGEAVLLKALGGLPDQGKAVVERAFMHAGQQVAATVIRTAQDFAWAGHSEPLTWLDALIERGSVDVNQLMLIANALPRTSLALAEHGVKITLTIERMLRGEVQAGAEHLLPSLATSLNNLAAMLSALGRREDALRAAEEAVALRRQLAADRPDAFTPNLATSLNNLAPMLSDLDRREDALRAAEEAVQALAPRFLVLPEAFAPWMTTIARNYLERCQEVGRDPDTELLAPIVEMLQRMQEGSGGET